MTGTIIETHGGKTSVIYPGRRLGDNTLEMFTMEILPEQVFTHRARIGEQVEFEVIEQSFLEPTLHIKKYAKIK